MANSLMEIKQVLKKVIIWRVALLVVAALALANVGLMFPYPRHQNLIELGGGQPLIWSWGGFDGVHYITISQSGYIAEHTQAFFPVYPYLIRLVNQMTGLNALLSGLLVSHIFLLVALGLFWKLLRLDLKRDQAQRVILTLLLFPTAFYLGAVYTESLFLALIFGAFLAARKKRWLASGLLGAIASATRPVGVFLFPALLVEWWSRRPRPRVGGRGSSVFRFAKAPGLLSICLVPLGLILYMIYLNNHFGDPLKFLHAQPEFGASRSDKIVLLYQVFWRYLKMLMTVDLISLLYFRVFQEVFWSLVFLVLGFLSFKKIRLSYAVFAGFSFLAPTLTGTFSSMPRYVLVMFPVFMMVGSWLSKHRRARWVWYGISGVLLAVNLSLFLTGRWVA